MKTETNFCYNAIIGKELYNFSLEPLKFPPNYPIKKPEIHLNPRYILQLPEPPLPLILSYQNVNRFFYKTQYTATSAHVHYYNSDHICLLDHDIMRCKLCGISLKWNAMADIFLIKIHAINYYEFNSFDSDFILFKDLKTITALRKYISFNLDRPLGQGLEDLYLKNIKCPLEVLTELAVLERIQMQPNESFKIIADFENSNILGFKYIRENKDSHLVKILMRGDTNSLVSGGFTHWFFFKIVAKKPISLTFEIVNFRKKMFNLEFEKSNTLTYYDIDNEGKKKWRFIEENVKYSKNVPIISNLQEFKLLKTNEFNESESPKQDYYTLRFNYSFETPKEVLFSVTYPYTYTNLMDFLSKQEKKLFVKGIKEQEFDYNTKEILLENDQISYNRIVLGSSLCGLPIFLIKLTSSKFQDPDLHFPAKYQQKKYILIIARQHPGEPPSSFISEGIISFLMSEDQTAQILRTFFIFLIVPMMNPDGVVLGNNRAGFSGTDFNRNWKSPTMESNPEISLVKGFIENLGIDGKKIHMFFDLHGHSHKKGMFIYSTPPSFLKDWELNEEMMLEWAKSSLFSNILQNFCKYLNIENCKSVLGKGKDESARVVMCKDFEIQFSYTIEASFSGYIDNKNGEFNRFKMEDYRILAKDLMIAVLEFNTILSEIEYMKTIRIKTETNDLNFHKYLAKIKKIFPGYKDNWKSYFTEQQMQTLYKKLEKFVDLVQESLFPADKESSYKQLENPSVANEQFLLDFYESNLNDKSFKTKGSPQIISNSSSFSQNKDYDTIDEEAKEELEIKENKKILGMMLFHEKDLKKTEKLLKKKAIKKIMSERQNHKNYSSIPKKRESVTFSGGTIIKKSPQSALYIESIQNFLEDEKKNKDNMTEHELIQIKDRLNLDNNQKKYIYSKYNDLTSKDICLPSNNDPQVFYDSKLPLKTDNNQPLTKENLFMKEHFLNKDNLYNKEKDAGILTNQISPLLKDNNSIIKKKIQSISGKESVNQSNENLQTLIIKDKANATKSSMSTGFTYNTTTNTSTPLAVKSRYTSASGQKNIKEFFEGKELQKRNSWTELYEKEQSDVYTKESMSGEGKEKRNGKNIYNKLRQIEINEINLPEEKIEPSLKKKVWKIIKINKTQMNSVNNEQNLEYIDKRDVVKKRIDGTSRMNQYHEDFRNNKDKSNENYKDYKEDVTNYCFDSAEKQNRRQSLLSLSNCLSKSRNGKPKLLINPFLKSKKEIYKMYSFKKPVIMIKDRNKIRFGSTLDENTINLNQEENIEGFSEIEEFKEKERIKTAENYKPFYLVKKSFF